MPHATVGPPLANRTYRLSDGRIRRTPPPRQMWKAASVVCRASATVRAWVSGVRTTIAAGTSLHRCQWRRKRMRTAPGGYCYWMGCCRYCRLTTDLGLRPPLTSRTKGGSAKGHVMDRTPGLCTDRVAAAANQKQKIN